MLEMRILDYPLLESELARGGDDGDEVFQSWRDAILPLPFRLFSVTVSKHSPTLLSGVSL